jgi:hypothetical protein
MQAAKSSRVLLATRIEAVLLSAFAGLITSLLLYLMDKISVFSLVMILLGISNALCIYRYLWTKSAIGFRQIWVPRSKTPIDYRIEDAKKEYTIVGVTLNSMLQITGIGVDIEAFKDNMPRQLAIRALLLHPDSVFFEERVRAVHAKDLNIELTLEMKRGQQLEVIRKFVSCFGGNVEIRFYNTYPAWWVQIVDKNTVYFATQTRATHIGQTYPFGMLLLKEYDSELFDTVTTWVDSMWRNSLALNLDGSIPALP